MNLWENSTEADKAQLQATARSQMTEAIRRNIMATMSECMGRGDWIVLNVVGIDAKKMFSEIFKNELSSILDEDCDNNPKQEE